MNVAVRPRRDAAGGTPRVDPARVGQAQAGPVGLLGLSLAVFLAGLLVLPPLWLGLVGVALVVVAVRVQHEAVVVPAPSRSTPVVVFATAAVALWISAVAPFVSQPLTGGGLLLVATFAVLPITAVAACAVPVDRRVAVVVWCGAAAGASFAGIFGLVEVVVFGARRADGTTRNAIVFGDLSLVMALLTVALMPLVRSVAAEGRYGTPVGRAVARWRLITATGAMLGLAATVVSGSRGAWLAVPVLAGVLAVRHRDALRALGAARLAAACVAIAVLVVRLSGSMPIDRTRSAIGEVRAYEAARSPLDPAAGTSIGARFEAWRAALWATSEHALTGVGWGNLQRQFGELAWARYRNPRIARFDHAHHQLISAAANSGLPGLVAWCAVMVIPARYFWRAAWHSSDSDQQSVGAAGLLVVFGYGVFGLTEAIFEQFVPLTFFAIVVALLLSQVDQSAERWSRGGSATGSNRRHRGHGHGVAGARPGSEVTEE